MTSSARELFTGIVRAIETRNLDALDDYIHPDFVGDFPQSGERLRGVAAWKLQAANYPDSDRGGRVEPDDPSAATIIGDEERWAISPNYTVVRLASANVFTIIQRTHYPDGSEWYVVVLAEVRDGKVYRADSFFAPSMPPPLLAAIGRPADG